MNDPFKATLLLEQDRGISLDPDNDWMQVAERLSTTPRTTTGGTLKYIPAIPMPFLRSVSISGDALPVLLIALAEMRMRNSNEIAIGSRIWNQAGISSKRVRARLLKQIQALPNSICVLSSRPGRPHLLKAGPDWPVAVSGGKANAFRNIAQ
jgi:hypothetical protein